MTDKLKKVLNESKPEDLLYSSKYRLHYNYGTLSKLKMMFRMTAIPDSVVVYDSSDKQKLGKIQKAEYLYRLAY